MADFWNDDDSFEDEQFAAMTGGGSPNERKVYEELQRRGFVAGIDFIFQADRQGGVSHVGNAKIHFLVYPLKVAIRVQGYEWPNLGKAAHALDILQRVIWEGKQYYVADLLALEVQENVRRVVGFALEHRMTAAAESVLR